MLIEVKKRYLITSVILLSLTLGLILVYAYGSNPPSNPSVFGHDGKEVDISASQTVGGTPTAMTLQNAIDNYYLGDRMIILQNQPIIDQTALGTAPNQWYIPATLPGPIPLNAKFAVLNYELQVSGLVPALAGKTSCPSVSLFWSSKTPQTVIQADVQTFLYNNGVGPNGGYPAYYLEGRKEQIVVPLIPGTGTFSFMWTAGGQVINPTYPCTYYFVLEGYIL